MTLTVIKTKKVLLDTFFAIFTAGVRAEKEGLAGSLMTPHEVITVVRAEDLERRREGRRSAVSKKIT